MKKKICSKCGNNPYTYVEIWNAPIFFGIDKNGYAYKTGDLEPGNPEYVEAHCLCGHSWRLRGVKQITDIRGENEEDDREDT